MSASLHKICVMRSRPQHKITLSELVARGRPRLNSQGTTCVLERVLETRLWHHEVCVSALLRLAPVSGTGDRISRDDCESISKTCFAILCCICLIQVTQKTTSLGRAKGGAKHTEKQNLARMARRRPCFRDPPKAVFLRSSTEGNFWKFPRDLLREMEGGGRQNVPR